MAESTQPIPSARAGARPPAWRSPRVACAALFLAVFVPASALIIYYVRGRPFQTDSLYYLQCASVMWRHGEFAQNPGAPLAKDHVAYVMFLAPFVGLLGPQPLAALFVQALLAGAGAILVFGMARRLGGDVAGWAAGLLYASYAPVVVFPAQFVTETLTIFGLLCIVWVNDRMFRAETVSAAARWGALLGALCALTAHVRMIAFPLVAAPAGLYALYALAARRQPARAAIVAGACLGAFALAWSPWVIRNQITFGRPIVLITGLDQTRTATHRVAEMIEQGHEIEAARTTVKEEMFGPAPPIDGAGGPEPALPKAPRTMEASGPPSFTTRARHCAQRLLIMLGLHPKVDAPYPLTGNTVSRLPVVRWAMMGWNRLLLALCAVALLGSLARRDLAWFNTLAIPGALITLYALVHAIPRYQIPSFAALTIPAGVAVARMIDAFHGAGRARAMGCGDKA